MDEVIFWSSIEYIYNKGSEDYEKSEGGFVYIFTNAFDVIEVLNKINSEFKKRFLKPVNIEYITPYDIELDWETSEETAYYLSLYNKAKKTGALIFDDFYAYEEK